MTPTSSRGLITNPITGLAIPAWPAASVQVSQSLANLSFPHSEVPCWTCRRRRLQCDKTLPTCQKCERFGRECLGYKKPLVWNKGVASRGKMMGKDFPEVKNPLENKDFVKLSQNTLVQEMQGKTGDLSIPEVAQSQSFQGDIQYLVDPIFQDFNPLTRYYLNYYAQKICSDVVLYDAPGENPFRDLIALIKASPLLLKTILATASRHATNNAAYRSSTSGGYLSSASSSESSSESVSTSESMNSVYHALWFKQNALKQLRNDLQGASEPPNDITIASILLFVLIEVLESGKNTWRVHLIGAKELLQVRDDRSANAYLNSHDRSRKGIQSSPPMHSHILDSCIIYDIMGSTLTLPMNLPRPIFPSASVVDCLKRSERLSFLGCPADLLRLILLINWQCWEKSRAMASASTISNHSIIDDNSLPLSGSVPEPYPVPPLESDPIFIIDQIQSFDPSTWDLGRNLPTAHSDITHRLHLASAYKSVVLIYALRVLRPNLTHRLSIPDLTAQAIANLSSIPIKHPFFKCMLWPTFIAGAEAQTSEQRDIVRQLFHDFTVELSSENSANAAAVLEEIWRGSNGQQEEAEEEGKNWMDYLAEKKEDWLFI